MSSASFHEIRFPLSIAFGATGGPERRTEVVVLGSGHEERNTRWANSRRRYDAGSGVRTLEDLDQVVQFFEERRGRLHGFRYRDPVDHKSCSPNGTVGPLDQTIGTGDGATASFQLVKRYGAAHVPFERVIAKPAAGSVRVAVEGTELAEPADFTVDTTTGLVTLATPPAAGAPVTAGFVFDTPVRFDSDRLEINVSHFEAGVIPTIPIVEIRP